jgi:hypothetical protein
MAKQDLYKLVEAARKELEGSNKLLKVQQQYNKEPHVYSVNFDNIQNEILQQIKRKRPYLSPLQKSRLDTIIYEYIKALHDTFKFRSSKVFNYNIFGNNKSFYVVITSEASSSDIYAKIAEIRKDKLSTMRNKIVKLFPSITTHLFEIDHMQSISEARIQRALSGLNTVKPALKGTTSIFSLVAKSFQYNTGSTLKEFRMYVTDESIAGNTKLESAGKNKMLVTVKQILDEFLTNNIDWGNQKGPNSALEIAISELLRTAKKGGARVKGNTSNRKSSTSTVSSKAVIKSKAKATKIIKDLPIADIDIPTQKSTNWSSLLPIINAKLAPRVMGNMRSPALVNRTGTLANSARLVSIEQTNRGFPSFVFDYQRNPYDVFDRTKGRSPWNTPERDPRALVDRSLREIISEMAIGRFYYTRRA